MAWYDDTTKPTHVATYRNGAAATKDAEKAARKGWWPAQATSARGAVAPVRRGQNVPLAVLLVWGGLSRAPDVITITYARGPGRPTRRKP